MINSQSYKEITLDKKSIHIRNFINQIKRKKHKNSMNWIEDANYFKMQNKQFFVKKTNNIPITMIQMNKNDIQN